MRRTLTRMSPEKTDFIYFAAAAAKRCEAKGKV